MAQSVKNLPAVQEMQVQSLCWADPLEEGVETHSSILAWEIPWTEEPGELQSMGSKRAGHNLAAEHTHMQRLKRWHDLLSSHTFFLNSSFCLSWKNFVNKYYIIFIRNIVFIFQPLFLALFTFNGDNWQSHKSTKELMLLNCGLPWIARSNQSIQIIHPGDPSWVFIVRTDVEAEAPILWPPDAKNQFIRKDPDAGEDWRQEKGMTEDELVEWHH